MAINEFRIFNNIRGVSLAGVGSVVALLALSGAAVAGGVLKVLVIAWVAFAAMSLGAFLGSRADETNPHRLVWGYGLASGAMVTSAAASPSSRTKAPLATPPPAASPATANRRRDFCSRRPGLA